MIYFMVWGNSYLGGGFKDFFLNPYLGETIQFDEHIFQMGWFNHPTRLNESRST